VPPVGNANYAWLQHFAHKLSPTGTAGIVLANGSMNSNSGGEGEIRKNMIEAGLIDCMVALRSIPCVTSTSPSGFPIMS
jgi:type I restriction enzyme M protein